MGILSSYKTITAIAALLLLGASHWYAYERGASRAELECDKLRNEERSQALQAANDARQRANQLEQELRRSERLRLQSERETEVRYETIEKEVIKYVENPNASQCELDADFLRIWNAANTNGHRAAEDTR